MKDFIIKFFFKKNILILLVFITQIMLTIPLKAMEESAELQSIELRSLPPEMLFKVALNLVPKRITDSLQIIKMFEDLTRLMAANSQFYDIIQDKLFLKMLEKKLIKRTSLSAIEGGKIRLEHLKVNENFINIIDRVEKELIAREAIKNAILQNDIETVKNLLPTIKKRNFNVKSGLFTPVNTEGQMLEQISFEIPALIYAVQIRNKELVELLLNHGANSNIHFTYPVINFTTWPLYEAIMTDNDELIRLLIGHGVNINEINEYGDTPLHLAAAMGNNKVVALLIANGANIEARNEQGVTPLIDVPNKHNELMSQLETALVLLKNNANVNAQSNTGKTALMRAVKINNPHLVAMLLKFGADVSIRDKKGRTALSIAQEKDLPEIIALLKKNEINK